MYEVIDVSAKCDLRVRAPLNGARRKGILLHTTDGRNSLDWLLGGSAAAGRPASADFLIARGGAIYRLMPRGYYPYHAGRCWWKGGVDDQNIASKELWGIEIENADSAGQVPTLDQHRAAAGLCLRLAAVTSAPELSVYGHYGLAYPMGRRSDPRSWDWGFMFWLMAHAKETIQLYGATDALGGY